MHCNLKIARKTTPRRTILGFNYEAHNAPAYTFNTFAAFFGFADPDVLSSTDILAIGGHLTCDFDLWAIDLEHF